MAAHSSTSVSVWFFAFFVSGTTALRIAALHNGRSVHTPRSMRGRLALAAMCTNETAVAQSGDFGSSSLQKLFGINRDSPEAMANQIEWARKQMDMEMPEQTVTGESIADREDMVQKYIESEREKFGREIDQATAEREIDQWLLKQATNASAKTEFSDIALGAFVFLLAFGYGIFASGGSGS